MTVGFYCSIKSYLRTKLGKSERLATSTVVSMEPLVKKPEDTESLKASTAPAVVDMQAQSVFLQRLPLEIRKIIYEHVWNMEGLNYHIYQKGGHLFHARCIIHARDEDPDLIQKEMDRLSDTPAPDNLKEALLQMWHRRLSGASWGHRHWRCEERLDFEHSKYGELSELDETSWMSMLLVCKRMHTEVLVSILESHNFLLNDLSSAHQFLVVNGSPLLHHIRHLDLSLSASSREFGPFTKNEPPFYDTRISSVLNVLPSFICLHHLRLSLGASLYEPWNSVVEEFLLANLGKVRALKKYTIELPATPSEADLTGDKRSPAASSFELVRQPPLRYWMSPAIPPLGRRVQRLSWEISKTIVA